MILRRLLTALFVFACLCFGAMAAESPLRGADLKTHLAGPKVTAEELIGKVVLLEYGGYY